MLSWLSFASGDRTGVLPACESGSAGDEQVWGSLRMDGYGNNGGTLGLYSRQVRCGASVN